MHYDKLTVIYLLAYSVPYITTHRCTTAQTKLQKHLLPFETIEQELDVLHGRTKALCSKRRILFAPFQLVKDSMFLYAFSENWLFQNKLELYNINVISFLSITETLRVEYKVFPLGL